MYNNKNFKKFTMDESKKYELNNKNCVIRDFARDFLRMRVSGFCYRKALWDVLCCARCNMASLHEVAPDALPYYDQGYEDAGVREMVNQLVEEETRRYRPTKNYLEFLTKPNFEEFLTPVLKNEFDRISKRQPMELLSMKRYELPKPAASQKHDVAAWTEAVENSMAQLQHQAERIINLELLSKYGTNAWRVHCDLLNKLLENQQKMLFDLRKQIQEINWQRKSEQSQAGEQLQHLEHSWVGLVSKNYEIERACLEIEKEIQRLTQEEESQNGHA